MTSRNDEPNRSEEGWAAGDARPLDCDPNTGICRSPEENAGNVIEKQGQRAMVELDYYTDPVCSWCWASEPKLRRLVEEYGEQLHISYKMGGLLESWSAFYDALNDIGKPEQVAPHWADVSRRSGMPVDEELWLEDPPHSAYPANIAVKAAQRQGEAAGERYLRRVREMALTERQNIERRDVLSQAARDVALDLDRFAADLSDPSTEQAFRDDMAEARSQGISGFPTLVFRGRDGRSIVTRGYQPYEVYELAIFQLAGELVKQCPTDIAAFVEKYGHVATQEVATTFGLPWDEAERRLAALQALGKVRRVEIANGDFWKPA
ncbi:MAG: DsbA family protein [Chloroflexi bacterium]|nr:DsbA family protein [Chloroflexota bacterium]